MRDAQTLTDERIWLMAARQGEPSALEQFYCDYHSAVYTLCYRMLGNEDDAQDAMQAAFVRAFRGLAGFRSESSLKTWLYRIAVNESVSLLRKRRGSPETLSDTLSRPDDAPGVTEKLSVEAALLHVSSDHRAILILRFWEELSYEEIVTILGISLPAVKMRIQRARLEFRKWYEEAS
jgi:RNA polymerase sigma-70 factor (ECF subfamily)